MGLKHQYARKAAHPVDVSKSLHFCSDVSRLRMIDGVKISAKEKGEIGISPMVMDNFETPCPRR